jgi:hypothetical protein
MIRLEAIWLLSAAVKVADLVDEKLADLVDESLKDPARMPNPVTALPTVGAN